MRLRNVLQSDIDWMLRAYADWPSRITEQRLVDYLRRCENRTDHVCKVGDIGVPVGLISYNYGRGQAIPIGVWVDNIVVLPELRRQGYATQMWRALFDELTPQGIMVARFKTLPGPIRDLLGTRFTRIDDSHGEVTWDMEI